MASSPSRTTYIKLTSLASARASRSSKMSSSLSSTRRISMGSVFINTTSLHIFAVTERDDELRPAPLARLYPRAPTVSLGDLPHDGKPRSRSLDLPSDGPLEKLKNAFGVLRRDSRAAVADSNTDDFRVWPLRLVGSDLHIRRFAVVGKLKCIYDEVVNRLGRPCLVHPQSLE